VLHSGNQDNRLILKMSIIAQGAEGLITKKGTSIIKHRVPKTYRLKQIDDRLRKSRTRKESKILESLPIPGPKLLSVDDKNMIIEMSFIDGPRLSDVLEEHDYVLLGTEIGKKIRKMHNSGIIHGDLTTSNMMLHEEVYFIDFGLSFNSDKLEDRAVDLHLLRQALESRHCTIWNLCFTSICKAYADKEVLKRLLKVENRGRNKSKLQ